MWQATTQNYHNGPSERCKLVWDKNHLTQLSTLQKKYKGRPIKVLWLTTSISQGDLYLPIKTFFAEKIYQSLVAESIFKHLLLYHIYHCSLWALLKSLAVAPIPSSILPCSSSHSMADFVVVLHPNFSHT